MLVELTPVDVPEVDGYYIKNYYSLGSKFISGPVSNYNLITEISLDKLNLLPGKYEVTHLFNTLSGFSYRYALPEEYVIDIEKDILKALPAEDFGLKLDDYGIEYGAVYTIQNNNSWDIIFNGKIVNSLHKTYNVDNLNLYIERNDRFEKIASVTPDKDAHFYLNHTVYGSIEKNLLVKIEYEGDGLYKPLEHVEYAGIEWNADDAWYFYDENKDGYPEWPFTIYDLLNVLSNQAESPPPPSLDFIAEFDEGSGTSTYDRIHNYEGLINGNTSWTTGRRDLGLDFDGDGILIENFDYVDFNDVFDNVLGNSNNEFIISGWIYPRLYKSNISDNGVKNCFFSKNNNIEIGINESGYLVLYLKTNTIDTTAYYGSIGAIPLNKWTYFAVRYNNSDIDVLIDDFWYTSALGSTNEPWIGSTSISNGGIITIGAEINSYSCFTGRIDDISIFNSSISNLEIESHAGGPILEINAIVTKEDGQGGWAPISNNGEIIDGYLNLIVNSTGKPIESLDFYLSSTVPNMQNPDPNDWNILTSYHFDDSIYSYIIKTVDIPDGSSWYLVVKASDDINNAVYDYYSIYFGINHFQELINFTYIDKDGRINEGSQIGVNPIEGCEWHASSLNLYLNNSGDIDFIANVSYEELNSNYWVIFLDSILDLGLSSDNHLVNFIVEANLSYSSGFPNYIYNYTLDQIILDLKEPEMELLSGGPYSLNLGALYDNIDASIITMAINSTNSDFYKVDLEYKYNSPSNSEWVHYDTFYKEDNSFVEISFNIINLRDDNISIRFTGYDNLLNSKQLCESNFWFIKDFNNHLEFVVEGFSNTVLYGLNSENMVDLNVKVLPVDNDITKVEVNTNYESFTLDNIVSEQDHIYFTDDGIQDPDIML
ncbi:MAG: LamG-like jellyroll fold domain-containing protein, partial [Promethearchaeota archaeon]